jgi:hypothetical protein
MTMQAPVFIDQRELAAAMEANPDWAAAVLISLGTAARHAIRDSAPARDMPHSYAGLLRDLAPKAGA